MAIGENNGERIRALEVAIEGYEGRFDDMDIVHGRLSERVDKLDTWKVSEQAGSAAWARFIAAATSTVVMILTIAKLVADYLSARPH